MSFETRTLEINAQDPAASPHAPTLRTEDAGPSQLSPLLILGVLCLLSLLARGLSIGIPPRVVFDETYYVNAARVIDGIRPTGGATYGTNALGIDPNPEHPPLGKLMIGTSIKLFGNRALGWRVPSLVAGTLAILALYSLARAAGAGARLSIAASALLAVENLFFVHSMIATLDILVLPFMLGGAALYLRGRPAWAGLAIGLGACIKVVAFSTLPVLAIFVALTLPWRSNGGVTGLPSFLRRQLTRLIPFAVCIVATLVTFLAVLYVLDVRYTRYRNPLTHISYMLHYAERAPSDPSTLPEKGSPITSSERGVAPSSRPVEWLRNQKPILYHKEITLPPHPREQVVFWGRLSPLVIYLALPAVAAAIIRWWRRRDRLSAAVLAWCGGTFGTLVVISLGHAYNYIYYMLVTVPGICLGISVLLASRRVPRLVAWGYGFVVGIAFLYSYPFRIVRLG